MAVHVTRLLSNRDKNFENESTYSPIKSVQWWGHKIISYLPSFTPSWVEVLLRTLFQIQERSHFPFLKLPKDSQLEVIKFLVPQKNSLATVEGRRIFQVSKECANLEVDFLKSRTEDVTEIMKKVQGNISKLRKENRLALEKIGPTITKLQLSGFSLTVKMVKEIVSYFPNLQELACANCGLKNSHIKEITRLKALVRLDVSRNPFSDSSLTKISELKNLVFLSLAYCQNINTQGLRVLYKLVYLEQLSIEGCKNVTDKSLIEVARLVSLIALNVSSCSQITAVGLQSLTQLKKLTTLSLKLCLNVKDEGLKVLPRFPQLAMLDLTSCYNITNRGLDFVFACSKLQKLVIAYFRVTDEVFERVSQLKMLKKLVIIGCLNLTNKVCESLATLTGLEQLTLENCEGITDRGLDQLKPLRDLQFLSVEGCHHISNTGVQAVTKNSNLKGVKFSKADGITGITFQHLSKLTKLELLSLKRCHNVSDADLFHLKEMKKLRVIGLIHCEKITERGRFFLKEKLPHVLVLDGSVPIDLHGFRLFQ